MSVGVFGMPDPAAKTLAGAAVRALVLPQLWVADGAGVWRPSLVLPGSEALASDGRSASFQLRRGAVWSNGAPIGAADLRRSADTRFVSGVDGPDADGRITVRFKQRLPGWQRLWSGVDSVPAPAPGVWGGPFRVAAVTPGLEAVLRRNPTWWDAPQPYLDEVRLVQVLDAPMLRQLFEQGELDVVAPPAYTVRSGQFPSPAVEGPSGWDVRLVLNPARLDEPTRRGLVGIVDRRLFVETLLQDEATLLHGWSAADDLTWAQVDAAAAAAAGDTAGLKGKTVQVSGAVEEPMTATLSRAIQKRVGGVGGTIEPRTAEVDRLEGWVAAGDFDAAIVSAYEGPSVCWTCRWSSVDAALATAADGGDATAARALQEKLRDSRLVVPLWRQVPFVAAAPAVKGVARNGYALNAAWNAWEWHRE